MQQQTALRLPQSLFVDWSRAPSGAWCDLYQLDLDHVHFDTLEGVYVIWQAGPRGQIVRVGQGHIRTCLYAHRHDPEIERLGQYQLMVSWARVAREARDGVERFLVERYRPLSANALEPVTAIAVNLVGD